MMEWECGTNKAQSKKVCQRFDRLSVKILTQLFIYIYRCDWWCSCSVLVLRGRVFWQAMGCLFFMHHPAYFLCSFLYLAIHSAMNRRQVIAYLLPCNKKCNQNKMLHRLFTLCSRPFTFCSTRAAGPPPPYGTYIYIETHRLGKLSVNHIGKW